MNINIPFYGFFSGALCLVKKTMMRFFVSDATRPVLIRCRIAQSRLVDVTEV